MTDYDQLLGEILDRGPSSETLGLVLGELKKLGHTRKVIQECIRALQHHPDDLPLRLILAEAYFDEGLLSQAEAEIETVTSRMDRYASAYRLQAEIYRTQKRGDEALRSLKTYLALRPQDATALDLLNEMELLQGVPEPEAAPVQEEIAEPAPAMAVEPFAPDETEPLAGEKEKPEFRFEEEVLSEIATPTLAEVYVNQGQIQEAISIYEKVIDQTPEDRASRTRVQELRTMLEAEPPLRELELPAIEAEPPAMEAEPPLPEDEFPPPEEPASRAKQKKQKTIAILESWLANIRKMSENGVSA
jgi:tetratricopeptide (TPR) repeat protein